MHDSGGIVIEVSVPSIGASFHSGHNYYSRQEGQFDFSADGERVKENGEEALRRLDEINERIDDPKLAQARSKLERATALDPDEPESERVKEAMDGVEEARRLLGEVRKRNLKEIRRIELERTTTLFNDHLRDLARPSEENVFDNLVRTAQRAIDRNDKDFERHLSGLRSTNFEILWRQDWFVVERFKAMASSPHWFADHARFETLVANGRACLQNDDIDALRQIIWQLAQVQIDHVSDIERMEIANIIKG